ncbi:transposase [Nonomuraea sp. KC401]|uniref:transposase n=1 Tax=Nonomuraea sp. KC401 TaxID=1848324 RepID=UPI0033931532
MSIIRHSARSASARVGKTSGYVRISPCRWNRVVERTVSWLANCRRLHRRYERRADHFASFVAIAAALLCYRRLAK